MKISPGFASWTQAQLRQSNNFTNCSSCRPDPSNLLN